MSYYDREMSELRCAGCGESHPMFTRQIFNPERYVQVAERFSQEHKDCAKFRNQAKAKAALMWRRVCAIMDGPTEQRRYLRRARA